MSTKPQKGSVASSLCTGSVFKYSDGALSSSSPHFFVVINPRPDSDKILLLLVATSNVDGAKDRRKLFRPDTVVTVSPKDYTEFSCLTAIDCNSVFDRPIEFLEEKFDKGELKIKKVMDRTIVDKLQNAALASDLVEEEFKDIIISGM